MKVWLAAFDYIVDYTVGPVKHSASLVVVNQMGADRGSFTHISVYTARLLQAVLLCSAMREKMLGTASSRYVQAYIIQTFTLHCSGIALERI